MGEEVFESLWIGQKDFVMHGQGSPTQRLEKFYMTFFILT
jgi:hypothetical protein